MSYEVNQSSGAVIEVSEPSRDGYEMSILATRLVASQADIELVRRVTRRASAKYSGACDESLKVFYLSKRGE